MTGDNEIERYEQAYLATEYVATLGPELEVTIRIGELCPDLDACLQSHEVTHWSFLTAWNPGSKPLPEPENESRNSRLELDLKRVCRAVFNGVGKGGDWYEKSFLALGLGKEEALTLANKYGQLAFVFGILGEVAELVESAKTGV